MNMVCCYSLTCDFVFRDSNRGLYGLGGIWTHDPSDANRIFNQAKLPALTSYCLRSTIKLCCIHKHAGIWNCRKIANFISICLIFPLRMSWGVVYAGSNKRRLQPDRVFSTVCNTDLMLVFVLIVMPVHEKNVSSLDPQNLNAKGNLCKQRLQSIVITSYCLASTINLLTHNDLIRKLQ